MRHMIQSFVPFFAVTFRSIDSPFLPLPVKPESPGRSTFGGVFCPTPFSRNRNFGGASLFGSAPWALASVLQICSWTPGPSWARRLLDDRERVRALVGRVVDDVQGPARADLVGVLVPAQAVLDVAVDLDRRRTRDGFHRGHRRALPGPGNGTAGDEGRRDCYSRQEDKRSGSHRTLSRPSRVSVGLVIGL